MSTTVKRKGLDGLRDEMSRQHQDALNSFLGADAISQEVANSIQATGRLVLLGMGASHWINRAVEPLYRKCGIDVTAHIASEYVRAPLPETARTTILTSQSGGSGEIIRYLSDQKSLDNTFGLTLQADSRLGQTVPCLLGLGGTEKAFAATRSLLISLALHGAVLGKLGLSTNQLELSLQLARETDTEQAEIEIAKNDCAVFVSRGALQGIAEAGSLCLMELGRIPAFAMEAGQFLHGPCEMLKPGITIVILRHHNEDNSSFLRIIQNCIDAGMTPLIFDHQDSSDLPANCIAVALPAGDELAVLADSLTTLQKTIVYASARKVLDVGTPVRSSKVTNGEI